MKQGSFRAVRHLVFLLVMVGLTVFSAFGDENTVDYESIILDTFDGDTNHSWSFAGKDYSYDFDWYIDASKFASKFEDDVYPKMSRVSAWPMAVFGTNREGKEHQSLGIWGKFDRRGYNWVDIYPIKTGSAEGENGPEPFEIPIPGRIQYLDMWVWGSNLNYYLEAYFRDHQGVVYNLYMGDLAYQGWKNMRTRIPTNIPQSKRVLPRLAGLTFVKFRLWTTPVERVDNFYVYIDQMKVLTDTFESLFDGDELADPDRVQELWGQTQAQANE
jgi:hypothetical protein